MEPRGGKKAAQEQRQAPLTAGTYSPPLLSHIQDLSVLVNQVGGVNVFNIGYQHLWWAPLICPLTERESGRGARGSMVEWGVCEVVAGTVVPDSGHGTLWCHIQSKAMPTENHLVLPQGEAMWYWWRP